MLYANQDMDAVGGGTHAGSGDMYVGGGHMLSVGVLHPPLLARLPTSNFTPSTNKYFILLLVLASFPGIANLKQTVAVSCMLVVIICRVCWWRRSPIVHMIV
jgi:hypothetical protein